MVVKYHPDNQPMKIAIEKIGKTHDRHEYNIPPRIYDLWVESLCEAVENHDSEWTPNSKENWIQCTKAGVDLITSMY